MVLLQGAFEIIHGGHVRALEYARSLGDYLIVALNSNELIRSYKKREPVLPWENKKSVLEALRCVDEVVRATRFSPMNLLKKHEVDVYVVSSEWYDTKSEEVAYMRARGGKVCVTRRFTGMSTTKIKERLLQEHLTTARAGSGDQTSSQHST